MIFGELNMIWLIELHQNYSKEIIGYANDISEAELTFRRMLGSECFDHIQPHVSGEDENKVYTWSFMHEEQRKQLVVFSVPIIYNMSPMLNSKPIANHKDYEDNPATD